MISTTRRARASFSASILAAAGLRVGAIVLLPSDISSVVLESLAREWDVKLVEGREEVLVIVGRSGREMLLSGKSFCRFDDDVSASSSSPSSAVV